MGHQRIFPGNGDGHAADGLSHYEIPYEEVVRFRYGMLHRGASPQYLCREFRNNDAGKGDAGLRKRYPHVGGSGDHLDSVSGRAAWIYDGDLWAGDYCGAYHRPYCGRTDDRRFRMEIHLLAGDGYHDRILRGFDNGVRKCAGAPEQEIRFSFLRGEHIRLRWDHPGRRQYHSIWRGERPGRLAAAGRCRLLRTLRHSPVPFGETAAGCEDIE